MRVSSRQVRRNDGGGIGDGESNGGSHFNRILLSFACGRVHAQSNKQEFKANSGVQGGRCTFLQKTLGAATTTAVGLTTIL
jgi:hypothetical protein